MNKINQEIAQIITDKFDAPVDEILNTNIGDDNISGYLISGGEAYFYNLDDKNIEIQHSPALTENINEYARGVLDETGIEYHGDSEYAWTQGYFRMDAAVKCKSGGVPCGNICLPRGKKCRKGAGGALRQVSRQIGTNPKLFKRQLEAAQKNLGKDFKTKMGMLGAGAGVVGAVALASHLMKGKKKPTEAEEIANETINNIDLSEDTPSNRQTTLKALSKSAPKFQTM